MDSLETVRGYIEQVFNRYKEELGYNSINISLTINASFDEDSLGAVASPVVCMRITSLEILPVVKKAIFIRPVLDLIKKS